jgi:apolipoprotein D and lipocalin family protein
MESTGKAGEGRYNIKYSTFPLNYDASLVVLDTDYDSFAVIWSCSRIGPFGNTQSAWLMTRERFAPGPIIQKAYGVLDKYKISRTFFIKTNQENCDTLPPAPEAVDEVSAITETGVVTESEEYDENDLGPDVIEVKKPNQEEEAVPVQIKPDTPKPVVDKNKAKPATKPTAKPTAKATAKPTAKATARPTSKETVKPAQ